MNILKPIDYVIYKISRIYRMGLDKRDPDVWVTNLLALWLIFNYVTILIWTKFTTLSYTVIPLGVFMILFMNIYYSETRFLKIEERYKYEPPKQKLWGSIAVITYVIATFILFICVVVYRNKLNGF